MLCPEDGGHEVRVGAKRGERFCPDHGTELRQPRKQITRVPGRKGTASYDRARRYFNNEVCGKRCFFADVDEFGEPRRPDHRCSYPLDGHHLVGKSWLEGNFPDLPEQDFLAIIFNPLIGAPLCRRAHDPVTINADYIYRHELRFEAIEFCESVDDQWGEILLPTDSKRQSMLERLRLESPVREVVA